MCISVSVALYRSPSRCTLQYSQLQNYWRPLRERAKVIVQYKILQTLIYSFPIKQISGFHHCHISLFIYLFYLLCPWEKKLNSGIHFKRER